jgi:hypothetical protein
VVAGSRSRERNGNRFGWLLMGLEMYPFIQASILISRSPFMACAVVASIGKVRLRVLS